MDPADLAGMLGGLEAGLDALACCAAEFRVAALADMAGGRDTRYGDLLAVALAFAFALTFLVYAFGGVSGAHLNPAVTISLAVHRGFPWGKVGPYIAAQMAGDSLPHLRILRGLGEADIGLAVAGIEDEGRFEDVGRFLIASLDGQRLALLGERASQVFRYAIATGRAERDEALGAGPRQGLVHHHGVGGEEHRERLAPAGSGRL